MSGGTWIVLGSSRLAPEAFDQAREGWPGATVATANAGTMLARDARVVPALLVVLDEYAVRLFKNDFAWCAENGSRCVTYHWTGVQDIFPGTIERIEVPMDNEAVYVRDRYTNANFSGLFALQLIMRERPGVVVLAGMDGYDGRNEYYEHADTFDGRRGPWLGRLATETFIAPFMRMLVAAHPETSFVQIGASTYEVDAQNYSTQEIKRGARTGNGRLGREGRTEGRRSLDLLGSGR